MKHSISTVCALGFGAARQPAGAPVLSVAKRALSASARLPSSPKRLPSFGQIEAIDLNKYKRAAHEKEEEVLASIKQGTVPEEEEENSIAPSLIKSFLYGSEETKRELKDAETSFSKAMARGKYVHELVIHKVKPGRAVEYLDLVKERYPAIANDPANGVHLVGSWRAVVGDVDTYIHIWEYNGYTGFHNSQTTIHADPKYIEFLTALRPTLRARENSLMQEFSFWGGTAAPRRLGGIFELRSYELIPGKLMEWETHWRKGIESRRKVMEPVGAWFTSIGQLNMVHHLWQFADLEHRKLSREASWEQPGWAETTHQTVKLINHMESEILVPLEFSPLK